MSQPVTDTRVFYRQRNNPLLWQLVNKILFIRERFTLRDQPDEETLRYLLHRRRPNNRRFDPLARARQRADDIAGLLPDNVQLDSYLDVGCGEGVVTQAVAERLQIPLSDTFGTDIAGWLDNSDEVNPHINFFVAETPYPVEQIALITALQSLHHVTDLPAVIAAIHSALQVGGWLVIREHDARNDDDLDLIDAEHFLYMASHDTLDKLGEYYGDYRSQAEWTELLTGAGFELVRVTEPIGMTRYYYALYRRL